MESDFEQEEHIPPQAAKNDADVAGLLKKIQQHLVFLEKKIDTLMSQSSERPSFRKDYGSRPERGFGGQSGWSGGGGKRHHQGEKRGGFGRERHFDREDRGNRGGDRGGFKGPGGGFRRKKKKFD